MSTATENNYYLYDEKAEGAAAPDQDTIEVQKVEGPDKTQFTVFNYRMEI